MIEMRSVCPPFGLIGPIDLKFAVGTFTALIGPNGAGKSTLLKSLAGTLKPRSGEVWTNNQDVSAMSSRNRGQQITLVAQTEQPVKGFSVRQSVSLGRYPHRSPWRGESKADKDAIDEAIEITGLNDLSDRDVSRLSGGEFQRVRLARALAQSAPALLLDEPTAALDLARSAQFLDLVVEIAHKRQLLVIAALHELNLSGLFADRIVVLNQGRINFDGPPSAALDTARLNKIYGAEFHGIRHPVAQRPQILVHRPSHSQGPKP